MSYNSEFTTSLLQSSPTARFWAGTDADTVTSMKQYEGTDSGVWFATLDGGISQYLSAG